MDYNGKQFESGGAVVTPLYIIAYPAERGVMKDWHGTVLGTYRIVASRHVNSYIGSTMHQIEATVNGVVYTGRGFGVGMIFKGKRKASSK